MKGDLLYKTLEVIGETAIDALALFVSISASGYGASHGRIQYNAEKFKDEAGKVFFATENKKLEKQRYQKMIYKLKKDGLLKEDIKEGKKFYFLTLKGKNKFLLLKNKRSVSLPSIYYKKEAGERFIIIIFDVPEKEKRKREWLRKVLNELDFKMTQKSVWIGKTKIPKEFIDDLFEMKMQEFVEIFQITKSGNLKEIL